MIKNEAVVQFVGTHPEAGLFGRVARSEAAPHDGSHTYRVVKLASEPLGNYTGIEFYDAFEHQLKVLVP